MASSRVLAGSFERSSFAGATGLAVPSLLAANLIWGTSFVATKPLLDTLPPASLAFGRLLVAVLVLIPMLLLTGRSIAVGWAPALLGVTGVGLTVVLQNAGLERTSATNAACLSGSVPAFTILFALLVHRVAPRRVDVLAMCASIVGVLVIVLADVEGGPSLSPAGDALLLASAASLAAYLVLGNRYFGQIDVVSLVAGSSLYGLVLLAPFAGYEATHTQMSMPDVNALMLLIYLGAGASAIAYCMEGCALSELASSQVAMFGNLAPAVGVVASVMLLGEALAGSHVVGVALVIAGAWLATRQCSRPHPHPSSETRGRWQEFLQGCENVRSLLPCIPHPYQAEASEFETTA